MKRFFTRNKKVIEIFLTLVFVSMVAGYYYLVYIPEREEEIVARRFRTLQRIEQNMQEKMDGYHSTIKNCLNRADEIYFRKIVPEYNKDTSKFHLYILDTGSILRKNSKWYDSIVPLLDSGVLQSSKFLPEKRGRKITLVYDWYKYQNKKRNNVIHKTLGARIDYREFVKPLLKKGVFDHYIVFNAPQDTSNIVYEDFPSGLSFKGMDSLFDTREKIYTSKIVKIETGGEKYLMFLHPYGYNNKNDRIVAGLLKQKTFDLEKRRLPDSIVTIVLFIALFALLLLPVIRLALMGKRERIRFSDLFTGYLSFLLLIPMIMLVFFWNNKSFIETSDNTDSKKKLADQISRSLVREITSAYNLLDTIDRLHYPKSDSFSLQLSVLDTFNIKYIKGSAEAHYFGEFKKLKPKIDLAVSKLNSYLKHRNDLYANTESVFWMDKKGKEIANWAFAADPPRGNYKDRNYFKNVTEGDLLSLPENSGKTYSMEPIVSRTDGKFKIVLARRSRNDTLVVASTSRFESVINPLLPLGYEFSIIDTEGKTVFDSDTTENLNENLTEEFIEGTSLQVVLNTKTRVEFKTRHEDKDFNVLAQPIPGIPYTVVILEEKSFRASLYTQSLSFTMMMMLSFFILLCFEMALVLIAHKQSTKLLKNNFDFAWLHPRLNFSEKYFLLFLYNGIVLLAIALFCFLGFSVQRLPTYIFMIVIASLATSIAAFAFETTRAEEKAVGAKRLKRERTTAIMLSIMAAVAILNSFFYSAILPVSLFLVFLTSLYFLLVKNRKFIHGHKDYMVNFRLMIFSRLLLTSGFPVVVFFNCIYNFEQRLQGRLKLLDYAENIQQRTREGENFDNIRLQLHNPSMVRSVYFDSSWILPGDSLSFNYKSYSAVDSSALDLLKAVHLHYNDVSNNTDNFEMTRPFVSNDSNTGEPFVFNNILYGAVDMLRYPVSKTVNNKLKTDSLYLTSGPNLYCFPAITRLGKEAIFWILLIASMGFIYLLLVYATNKIFGKFIPGIEDFKRIHDDLLRQKEIKYLFVQGVPGAGKRSFIKDSLDGVFDFCEQRKETQDYNAVFFNLNEIPSAEEMQVQKEAYDKAKEWGEVLKNNWYYKVSEIMSDKIKCVVFTHFEYKIFDEYTNDVKLSLIEKVIGLGKEKIILSSDIDPLEYFYSLKKFMPATTTAADQKKDSTSITVDGSFANTVSLEFQNRWNNLLGRFANIFMNIKKIPVDDPVEPFKKKFLDDECSRPAFLKNYKALFQQLPVIDGNEEDYILKIQSLCDHAYRQIFASLTKEEQLILYDLAEDGLINTTNYIAITMLLSKGLIVKDENAVLTIVNRSFRNFILTIVKSEDIKYIEKEITDNQTWNDYKYPVFILLGALLYFVLSSNPEKFGDVLPVITGILTGIPTVMKMLSFMKPGGSQA